MKLAVLAIAATTLLVAEKVNGPIILRDAAPAEVRAGDVVVGHGQNLDATRVLEVFLTNAAGDFKAEIVEQNANEIHFRIPVGVPAGKLRIAVVTEEHMMLDQPVFIKVAAPGPTGIAL